MLPISEFTNTTNWCSSYGSDICSRDGWLTCLRRIDNSVNFSRPWAEYKAGFGDKSGNFWLGLEDLHNITNNGQNHEMSAYMQTRDKQKHLNNLFKKFQIQDEMQSYKISIGGY